MSTPAQRAHLKLIETLTARTIPARPRLPGYIPLKAGTPGSRPPEQTKALNIRIKELHALGWQDDQVASELQVSRLTVWRHLSGKVKVCR